MRCTLRWLTTEQRDQIVGAVRQRKMMTVDFVLTVLKRYLAGNALDQPVGICQICKRREAARSRQVKAEAKIKAKPEPEAESGEDKAPATCPRHGLRFHPGCLNPDSSHAHGPWWPREDCDDPDCAKRMPGWNLPNVRAKRKLSENL